MIEEGKIPPQLNLKDLLEKLNQFEQGVVINTKRPITQEVEKIPEEKGGEFNEYEINVISEAISQGFNVWKIVIRVSEDCLMKGVRAFMVFRNFETWGGSN